MTAVIYARYSSDKQREESIEGQIRECTAYAEKNGITIVKHYIDRAISAKTDNRPQFQQMIKDSDKKLFDIVLVWKLDRFARNRYDSARYKTQLKKNGVKLMSATEIISEGPEGIILESVLEGYAEYYSADLAEKVVRGQTENILKGRCNGGRGTFGYTLDSERKFHIDPLASPFVLESFTKYRDGLTMKEIRDWLNENGIKNPVGGEFTYNSVEHMLKNRRYIGELKFRDVVVPDAIPPIVPLELFDDVQEKIAKNKKAPARRKAEDDYLLTTKLHCGCCGALMFGESGTSRTGEVHRYYKCATAKKKKGCKKKTVRKQWLEDLVVNQTMQLVRDDAAMESIIAKVMELQDRENTNLPLYEKQLRDAESGIQNMLNAIQAGILTSSTKERLEQLEETKRELEARIAEEKLAKPKIKEEFIRFWLMRFRKLDMSLKDQRQALVDTFINSIYLYDDKVLITFNYKEGTQTITFEEAAQAASKENGSEMERFTGRVDASNKYKKVEFGMNASFSWTKNVHLPEGKFYGSAIYASKVNLTPSTPIYNEDGTYASGYRENNGYNPVLEAEVNDYYARTVRAMGTAKIAYNVWDNLKISSVFTVDYSLTKDFFFQSPEGRDGATYQGRGRMQMTDRMRYTSQNNLTYSKTFGKHSVSAVAAFEVMKYDYEDLYAAKKTYGQDINTSLGNAADPIDADQKLQEDALMSYVASVNYSYGDKYYASFSFRRDGSSRLSPDTRWGNFWSLSASWRLSQEKFMQPLKSVLSDLKLRASYGVNGNLPSSYYGYQSTYTTGAFYSGKPSPWESTLGNEELTWEKNYALNLGLDIGLFSRVNVSLDWYTRTTKDLLMSKQLNSISGFSSLLTNVGQMRNTGVELEVRSNNIKTKDFSWTTAFNLSHNKNKILKLADLPWFVDGRYVRKEGYPFNTIYLREYAGVDPETGSALYYDNQQDENGNYTKNKVTDPGQASPIPLKDITPTISGGFMNTFNYKFIDLSFNLSYSFGGYSYDNASYILQDDGYSVISNKSTEQRRRWQKPGDITDVPRFVYGNKKGGNYNSSRAIHSTDHIRLKSLILGLNAPKAWLQKLGIGNARIYFSGTNLLTWAAYDQYDPEMSGVVGFYTPPLKTYAFGLELKF